MSEYRLLKKGEIILPDDEVDNCRDPYRDDPIWIKTLCAGQQAPDPQFISHRQYRRKVKERQV